VRTFDTETTNALAASRRQGALCYRIVDTTGKEWLLTNWPAAITVTVTIAGSPVSKTFQPAMIRLAEAVDVQSPNSAIVHFQVVDPGSAMRAVAQGELFRGGSLHLWLLLSRDVSTYGWGITLLAEGSVERTGFDELEVLEFEAGPVFVFWATSSPPLVGPTCRYVSTTQCSYANSCAKTPAACAANGKTATAGFVLHLIPPGTVLEFRDSSSATSVNSGSATGPKKVVMW